jgi:hypothetical protein
MENDSIRASGANILVDMWIEGRLRAICVTREAIGSCVGFDKAAAMPDDERCEFVRSRLGIIVTAAKAKLREGAPIADTVVIDAGDLPDSRGMRTGDRRKADRRKGDRRKTDRPRGGVPQGDRRRSDRRKTDRRGPSDSKGK